MLSRFQQLTRHHPDIRILAGATVVGLPVFAYLLQQPWGMTTLHHAYNLFFATATLLPF